MSDTSIPLRGHLLCLQLESPEPERMAHFYARIFGMTAHETPAGWICKGHHRCLAFVPGEAKAMRCASYAAASAAVLNGLAARTAASTIELSAIDRQLYEPGAIAFRDPDGNRVSYGMPRASGSSQTLDAPPARLQHVVVGSTDVQRMVEFYTGVVGLRETDEVRDEHGDLRTVFMRSDDEHHSFAVFQTARNRLDHHCYELPDWNSIRDWGDRLASFHIPVQWGPGRHGPGNNLFLFFHDPDGNWVELSAELEIVSADRAVGIWKHEERTLNSWGRGYLRS